MALDLVTRLTLDTQQYDKNLQKSKESLESFKKKQSSVGNSTNIFANGMSKSIGGLVGSIGKLVPAFTAASIGFEAFNRHLKMNEYALDSFNKMSEQANAAIDQLAESIINLNALSLSNIVSQVEDLVHAQGELYDAKDTLGTYKIIMSPDIEKWEAKRIEAQTNYKDAKARGDKEAAAKYSAELKKASDEEKKLIQGEIDLNKKVQKAVYETIKVKSGLNNLTDAELNKISKGFLYYDKNISKEGSFKYVKGKDYLGLGTKSGTLGEIVVDFYENRKFRVNKQESERERKELDKYIKRLTGMSSYELYRATKVRGVGEESGIKEYYGRDTEIWRLTQRQGQIDKQDQKLLKDESKINTATTKTVQKQEKTINEFQDAIDRFKSTVSALKEQKESGVITDANYRDSFQSALSNMAKTLMSADIWNKLTDGQKEYVKQMSSLLMEMNDIDKALLDYNSKSKTDYSDLKKSDEKRATVIRLKMIEDAYRDKDPKSTFLGTLIKGVDNEEKTREFERLAGKQLANRLKTDKNIDLGKLDLSTDKGEIVEHDEIMRNLGKAFYSTKRKNNMLFNMDADAWKAILNEYGEEVFKSIGQYFIELKHDVSSYDVSKEAPRFVSSFQTEDNMLKSLFMKSNPGATERDFLEFLNSYYKSLTEDLANRQQQLDERGNAIDEALNALTELQNKYDEAVKAYQNTGDETILKTIELLEEKITKMKKDIADLQAEKKQNTNDSNDNQNKLGHLREKSIDTHNKLVDNKELDEKKRKWEELADAAYHLANAFGTLSNAFAEAGNKSAASAFNMIGGFTQMIGVVGEAIAKIIGLMAANNVEKASELPFPANLTAIATAIGASASIAATIMGMTRKKYAHGGIVQGIGSSFSDQIPISVSNGEMILNKGQQRNLFNLLDRGIGVSSLSSGDVTFKIKGNVMEGTLKNHNSQMRKIK
jgi:hypothetical protein